MLLHRISGEKTTKLPTLMSLHCNQKRVVEYGSCLLSAINDAILLYTVVAMGPIPPAVENTKGEKDPCSISLTLSSYSLFLSSSCFLQHFDMEELA